MLAGRTLSTSAPRASSAFTFSQATSSGMIMALMTQPVKVTKSAHTINNLTGIITSGTVIYDQAFMRQGVDTHRARAIVAIEIPVDPTVPSKIREPVYGRKIPSRSASSITLRADGQPQPETGPRRRQIEHTSECDTVLYAATRIEILYKS